MYNKILVPFDGSTHAQNALRAAGSLIYGRELQSHVTVLYVVHSVYSYPGVAGIGAGSINLDKLLEEEGKRLLQRATQLLDGSSVDYNTQMVFGDPAQEVCKLAEQEDYDLIVMGSRGLGVMTELALGSVSHKVIQRTNKPVMIIK